MLLGVDADGDGWDSRGTLEPAEVTALRIDAAFRGWVTFRTLLIVWLMPCPAMGQTETLIDRAQATIDVDPFTALPFLARALQSDSTGTDARQNVRAMMDEILLRRPSLIRYWPTASVGVISEDGALIGVAVQKDVVLYDLRGTRQIGPLSHPARVEGLTFTLQGDRLAVVYRDGTAPPSCRLWYTHDGSPATKPVNLEDTEYGTRDTPRIYFTGDGDRMVAIRAGMYNRWHSKMAARIYNSRTLEPLSPTFAHHSNLDYINGYHVLSPDRLRVLVHTGLPASDARAPWSDTNDWPEPMLPQQYDLMTGKAMHAELAHELDFYADGEIIYNNDGTRIATSGGGRVKVWDGVAGVQINEFALSSDKSRAKLRFHPDGDRLFIIEMDRSVCWDVAANVTWREWKQVSKFIVSPNARYIVYKDIVDGDCWIDELEEDANEPRKLPKLYAVGFCRDDSLFHLWFERESTSDRKIPSQLFRSTDAQPIFPPWRFARYGQKSYDGSYQLITDDDGVWLWQVYPPRADSVEEASSVKQHSAHDSDEERFAWSVLLSGQVCGANGELSPATIPLYESASHTVLDTNETP
ncbi:MAG: hypothetical protein R3E01_18900 [Pirellulaceae bacterium]|nr:hypothetical protein [Planctomycetales bacterium]